MGKEIPSRNSRTSELQPSSEGKDWVGFRTKSQGPNTLNENEVNNRTFYSPLMVLVPSLSNKSLWIHLLLWDLPLVLINKDNFIMKSYHLLSTGKCIVSFNCHSNPLGRSNITFIFEAGQARFSKISSILSSYTLGSELGLQPSLSPFLGYVYYSGTLTTTDNKVGGLFPNYPNLSPFVSLIHPHQCLQEFLLAYSSPNTMCELMTQCLCTCCYLHFKPIKKRKNLEKS